MSARNVGMGEADTELCQAGMRTAVSAALCASLVCCCTSSGAAGHFPARGAVG